MSSISDDKQVISIPRPNRVPRVIPAKDANKAGWGNGRGMASPVDLSRALPICPYGCGEEGQLKEVIMGENNRAIGIFADSDGCVFIADIEVGDPPTPHKLVIGPDGEYHQV